MGAILWAFIAVCVIVWVILLALKVTFWGIHLLLVLALVLFVINLLTGRKS